MKIKYKYWRIDGSCVVGGDNVALHYFPILLDPLLPRSCCLSFFPSVRVSQQRVSKYNFSNLSPFSPCRGRETRFTLERKRRHTFFWYAFIHVFFYERSSSISSIVSLNGIWIYFHSLFYYKERRGGGESAMNAGSIERFPFTEGFVI